MILYNNINDTSGSIDSSDSSSNSDSGDSSDSSDRIATILVMEFIIWEIETKFCADKRKKTGWHFLWGRKKL